MSGLVASAAGQLGMNTGVYAIVNLLNGHVYIGSASVSFDKRFRNHRHDLSRGQHHCEPLQRAWNKYGPGVFEFAPLELTNPQDAVGREQAYIDAWRPRYNVAPIAGTARGVKHSEASRARMSAAQRKLLSDPAYKERRTNAVRAACCTPEARARRSAAQSEPEVSARRSASCILAWADEDIRARAIAGMKVAFAKPENRARRAEITRQRNIERSGISSCVVSDIQRGLAEGASGAEMARRFGISQSSVSRIKRGEHCGLVECA